MPNEDPELAFAQAAADDGIALTRQTFDWLNEQGHVGLERIARARKDSSLVEPVTAALEVLKAILGRLRGDVTILQSSRLTLKLPARLVHEPTGTVIEVDGSAHFTSFREKALDLYPPDAPVGFDVQEHKELCREWCAKTDAIERGLAARAFGFGGKQPERAYNDALRDFSIPAMGHPPLIRIAAVDGDGEAAYRRHRDALRAHLDGSR